MSHFTEIALQIKDIEAIKLAFAELYSIPVDAWQYTDKPVVLKGWGNKHFKANLVLPLANYQDSKIMSQSASYTHNDLGFVKSGDGYNFIITDENRGWWQSQEAVIMERIGVITAERKLTTMGARFERQTLPNGRLQVKATLYRH